MGCWNAHSAGYWQERVQEKIDRHRGRHQWGHHCGHRSSGNRAFDAYRAETLRRLEEEETEFREFLDRLRFAKDKAQFDEFLAQRRGPAGDSPKTDA